MRLVINQGFFEKEMYVRVVPHMSVYYLQSVRSVVTPPRTSALETRAYVHQH
jgi:hypothetical protein